MFWLGLILPICYVAGWTGATIPTQWAVLSVALLPALWRDGAPSSLHWIGLAFVAFAAASLLWTLDISMGLWIAIIWALAFWYGSTAPDLGPLWRGLALGMGINAVVAAFQFLGYRPVPSEGVGGLLFNPTFLGAAAALVAVALIGRREWLWLAGPLPAVALAQSRGAWAVLAISLAARVHWAAVVVLIVVGVAAVGAIGGQTDLMRLHFWVVALKNLTLFGNGVGSFNVVHVAYHEKIIHAENVHNDYLQLAFEFGIMAMVPVGILAAGLWQRRATDWPVLVGFAALGAFFFPLWCPVPAFIGCVVAGNILRGHDPLRGLLDRWRFGVLFWGEGVGFRLYPIRRGYIPPFERFTEPHEISAVRHQ